MMLPGCLLHTTICAVLMHAQRFPEYKIAPIGLSGAWERAEIIAVGDLEDVVEIGSEILKFDQWPVTGQVARVYWCEGKFLATAAVRGKRPEKNSRYRWGSIRAGCDPTEFGDAERWGNEPFSKVWLMRWEKGILRPVVDAYGVYYSGIHQEWKPTGDPERHFGEMLLTPEVQERDLDTYAGAGFFNDARIACMILGEKDCIKRIMALARRSNPALTKATCQFLQSQFNVACP